ncbi:MAG: hypothetical protein CME04_18505 [Gemmatimonadaceae bacterium]|nr:hypothetical protein [Gemmatimonadaceae bacterium]
MSEIEREIEREIELYDYIEVLLKYKWFILAVTVVCGGFGWTFRPAPPPTLYEADVVLMIKHLPTSQTSGDYTDIPSVSQTSGFFQALALADDLKQALIDSLNLRIPLSGMDGLLQVQVLDPGIRLAVRSNDPTLPIPLVNTWAALFVARNGDLTLEEAGSYYDWVEDQYDIALAKLDCTEAELRRFRTQSAIGFLVIQRAALDTAVIAQNRRQINTRSQIEQLDLELQGMGLILSSLDSQLFRRLAQMDAQPTINKVLLAQAYIDSQIMISLQQYDAKHDVAAIMNQKRAIINQKRGDEGTRIVTGISNLEQELSNHEPVLGGVLNPTYVALSDQLSEARLQYSEFKLKLVEEEKSSQEQDAEGNTRISADALTILQRRKLIIDQHLLSAEKYSQSIVVMDSITVQEEILKRQMEYHHRQFLSLSDSLDAIKGELANRTQYEQRLVRDRDNYNNTIARFSKLLEEARIVWEKSAGDMRVLTQALEVRPILQDREPHRATIAIGAGLLLSTFGSLLIEYVRQARRRRAAAADL